MRSNASLIIVAGAILGLAGCSSVPDAVNPISWYRHVAGTSKNDDLQKGQNNQNPAEGGNEPHANLTSVPEAPNTAPNGAVRVGVSTSVVPSPPQPPQPLQPSPPSVVTDQSPGLTKKQLLEQADRLIAEAEAGNAGSDRAAATWRVLPSATPASPPAQLPPPQVASAAPPAAMRALPPAKAPTQPATALSSPKGRASPFQIAQVNFEPGSASLSEALRGTIAKIVKNYNENGGSIRIVGHGAATGTDAAIAGLTLALDRAQAVAVALTDGGVPATVISVETAPVPAAGGRDLPRADVYLKK